jgi:hypothetical protein
MNVILISIFVFLLFSSFISIFIPHNDKVYNLSWYSRILTSITLIYLIMLFIYGFFNLIFNF